MWGGGAYGPSRPLAPRSLTVAKRAPKEEAAFLNSEGRGEKLKVRLVSVVGSVVGRGTAGLSRMSSAASGASSSTRRATMTY